MNLLFASLVLLGFSNAAAAQSSRSVTVNEATLARIDVQKFYDAFRTVTPAPPATPEDPRPVATYQVYFEIDYSIVMKSGLRVRIHGFQEGTSGNLDEMKDWVARLPIGSNLGGFDFKVVQDTYLALSRMDSRIVNRKKVIKSETACYQGSLNCARAYDYVCDKDALRVTFMGGADGSVMLSLLNSAVACPR